MTGDADCQHLAVALLIDSVQNGGNQPAVRQRGLGDFCGQAAIDLTGIDGQPIQILCLVKENLERDHKNMVTFQQLGRHIAAGVHQNSNFFVVHKIRFLSVNIV